MYKKKKKDERKKYRCSKCESKAILEYTERFAWYGNEPDVTKAEVKCPHCNRTYWIKIKKKVSKS